MSWIPINPPANRDDVIINGVIDSQYLYYSSIYRTFKHRCLFQLFWTHFRSFWEMTVIILILGMLAANIFKNDILKVLTCGYNVHLLMEVLTSKKYKLKFFRLSDILIQGNDSHRNTQ